MIAFWTFSPFQFSNVVQISIRVPCVRSLEIVFRPSSKIIVPPTVWTSALSAAEISSLSPLPFRPRLVASSSLSVRKMVVMRARFANPVGLSSSITTCPSSIVMLQFLASGRSRTLDTASRMRWPISRPALRRFHPIFETSNLVGDSEMTFICLPLSTLCLPFRALISIEIDPL